jgi:thymidylate kinase
LAAYNSLLAVLKLEKGAEFETALERIEEAKEKCVSTAKPDEHCHTKSQEALKYTKELYDKILEEYRKKLPNRPPPPRT